ncbi:MAG: Xaa-Pro peptidase family protein [Planctomycetota bacterium]
MGRRIWSRLHPHLAASGNPTTMPVAKPVARAKAYLKARHRNLKKALEALKLDCLLVNHAPDCQYLTNFTGHDSVVVFRSNGLIHLVTDFRYEEQANQEAGWLKLLVRGDKKMPLALAELIGEVEAKRIGFDANTYTYGQIQTIRKQLAEIDPDAELVPLEDVMLNQRKVKDDHEIGLLRKSVALAEESFEAIRDSIEPGVTEAYLAGLLISELRSRGADGTSFEPIVATAENSALPHYGPKDVLVKPDEPLLFDWGCRLGGYCSDLTRTFVIGRVAPEVKKIHKIVLEAQEKAIAFLRPGVSTQEADGIARKHIEKAGYGPKFGHSLGHGIGLDIHELPSLRKTEPVDELRPGMVVTVEPGIYLPGIGGVRIEDDVLITHSGCEVLSTLPRGFEDCHIG